MIKVVTEIRINAPIEVCFDLARDIDIHTQTVWPHTRERAVAGTTRGMIGEGETVTFEATHFLIRQRLSSRITDYQRPYRFVDEMMRGAFKSLRHEHSFQQIDRNLMFEAPLGVLGWVVERVILKEYMKRFLQSRNHRLKEIAESK